MQDATAAARVWLRTREALVSPITLLRVRGHRTATRREHSDDGHSGASITVYVARMRARVVALPHVARPALATVLDARRRVWLAEWSAILCVVGGFLAAPLLSLLAWIGLLLPSSTALHRTAETLFIISIVWLSLALVTAHSQHDRHHQPEE